MEFKLIVQNYGLYWKRSEVRWGSKGHGNSGSLDGRLVSSRKSVAIDFRKQAGIYVLQDGFRAIYIGQAGSGNAGLFNRLRGHTRNFLAERWDRFSWFGIYPVIKDQVVPTHPSMDRTSLAGILDHLEGTLIAVTEPPLNRQGPRFGAAGQYIQDRVEQSFEADEIETETEDQ